MSARFKVGDRVMWNGGEHTLVVAEPDRRGDYIVIDGAGEYWFARERDLALVPPPDPRDAVVEAAVAWADCTSGPTWPAAASLRDAVEAWKAAQS